MSNEITASVILPIYNAAETLDVCLSSLLSQGRQDIEIVMVNDGSTDGSDAVCRRYAERDSRFRLVSQSNAGVSAARNRGLEEARGRVILFVDSDDRVDAGFADRMISALDGESELAVCGYYECFINGDCVPKDYGVGRVSRKRYALRMAHRPTENYYGVLWNKGFLRDVIDAARLRFDERSSYGEDEAFVLSYLPRIRSVTQLSDRLYYYSFDRADSLSNGRIDDAVRIERTAYVYRNYVNFWRQLGCYKRYAPLVKYCGARLYYNERREIEPSSAERLYKSCLEDNGFTAADRRLFASIRAVRRMMEGKRRDE